MLPTAVFSHSELLELNHCMWLDHTCHLVVFVVSLTSNHWFSAFVWHHHVWLYSSVASSYAPGVLILCHLVLCVDNAKCVNEALPYSVYMHYYFCFPFVVCMFSSRGDWEVSCEWHDNIPWSLKDSMCYNISTSTLRNSIYRMRGIPKIISYTHAQTRKPIFLDIHPLARASRTLD